MDQKAGATWDSGAKTQVCITVDVEPTVGGAFANPDFEPLLHEPVAGEVGGRSEALGFILRALGEFGLPATFFVETLHAVHFGEAPMGAYVDRLRSNGQDVQLHVHPCWLTFAMDRRAQGGLISDRCAEHSQDCLIDFFGRGADQIERWTGERPNCIRTGGFSVSRSVFKAINKCGLRTSSNICVGYAPSRESDLRVPSGACLIEGVMEYPVTCFRDHGPIGRGRYRNMQITACAWWELRALLEDAYRLSYPYVIIVTHPFEFLKRDSPQYRNLTVNRINQFRFRWLCSFLAENKERFSTVTMRALADQSPNEGNVPPTDLRVGSFKSLLRTAQNALNDGIKSL